MYFIPVMAAITPVFRVSVGTKPSNYTFTFSHLANYLNSYF